MAESICIGSQQTVEFFQNLGATIDDIDIYDSLDEDFCEKYNRAMNRLKYLAKKDLGAEPKVIKKVYGGEIKSINCGHCGAELQEPYWKHCPNCGYGIKR